jgi:ribosome biogenesis protein MAK21
LDPLLYIRTRTISFIFALLKERPEQEHNLLRLLVNKLVSGFHLSEQSSRILMLQQGDSERTVCSSVSHYILQLIQEHPSMKGIVVREMTSLVFRPAASSAPPASTPKHIRFDDKPKPKPTEAVKTAPANAHAAYYATITFNQIVLSPSPADQQVARQLVDIYFTFFRDLLGVMEKTGDVPEEVEEEEEEHTDGKFRRKGKGRAKTKGDKAGGGFLEVEDTNSKHISAILTGVNRALPFAKLTTDDAGFTKHVDTLFLITHQSTFNISLQALVLLHQITVSSSKTQAGADVMDRFYRTLYASLHDPRLATSNKQAMYLNLIFKSGKSDPNPERVAAFVRRFLQVLVAGGGGGPEFIAGGLYVIGEVCRTFSADTNEKLRFLPYPAFLNCQRSSSTGYNRR